MNKTPTIAIKRREESIANFTHKLDVLGRLLAEGITNKFLDRLSISGFAAWEDFELKVLPISRSIIYCEAEEYLVLRQRMEHLLKQVSLNRSKAVRKKNLESDLRARLKSADEKAQSYVNQYSIAMADLAKAKQEIQRLTQQVRRQIASNIKVLPLREVLKDTYDHKHQPKTTDK